MKNQPKNSLLWSVAAVIFFIPIPAGAQSSDDINALLQELTQLRSEQAKINARVNDIEKRVESISANQPVTPVTPISITSAHSLNDNIKKPVAGAKSKFDYSGDLRLRYEGNSGGAGTRSRERGVFRGRLRGNFQASDRLVLGAELVTGDRDDPNTADVTLSQFADDIDVGLSQLYAKLNLNGFEIFGGKFPQLFQRTDLVWDGDVNPQGIGVAKTWNLSENLSLNSTGLYFIVDEAAAGSDSNMIGGQLTLAFSGAKDFRASLSAAYYDYEIDSISGADVGDFRSNARFSDGKYISDFNLLDLIATIEYQEFGERWPIVITVDYVKNLGAKIPEDEGLSARISAGSTARPYDWQISYGYSQAETDAVFAAFSHDNISLATNYKGHEFGIDYALSESVFLNATWYHFHPLSLIGVTVSNNSWQDRFRLNATINF